MLLPLRHKVTAFFVAALLLLQYAPVAALVMGHGQDTSCTHCNGSFCLRTAQDGDTKCAHHHAAQGARSHTGTMHHDQQPPASRHAAHGTHPGGHAVTKGKVDTADTVPQICGCDHRRPEAPPVIALDKVVVGEITQVTLRLPHRSRFASLQTAKPDRFATELFHPPRRHV